MSDDLIKRSDAIKAINAMTDWYQVTCNGKQIAVMLKAKDVNETLEKVPSADRPQGEWIDEHENGHGYWVGTCNQCGKENCVDNFCPNCGADMRKEADDE